jgi:hypothetical protein
MAYLQKGILEETNPTKVTITSNKSGNIVLSKYDVMSNIIRMSPL